MKQYKEMLNHVMSNGENRKDRTGTGIVGVFGYQTRFDLRKGFPLLTTKNTAFRIIVQELLWFLRGETNIKPLVDANVKIWNDDAYRWYMERNPNATITQEEFIAEIEDGDWTLGKLGPVYGHQWRSWNLGGEIEVDQIERVIQSLIEDPYGRRHLVTAWNPAEIDGVALPPCHVMFQFYVNTNGELSCQLYQRSADLFLGVPFNIASYALLTHYIAGRAGLKVAEFIHTFGDLHIYNNHLEQVMKQIEREPRELPLLHIRKEAFDKEIEDLVAEDFEIIGYDPHPTIKGKVSVGL